MSLAALYARARERACVRALADVTCNYRREKCFLFFLSPNVAEKSRHLRSLNFAFVALKPLFAF